MSQEDKNVSIKNNEKNISEEKSNNKIKENINTKNELIEKIKQMQTKFLSSKKNFMIKINKFISEINQDYDKYMLDIYKTSEDLINDKSKTEENLSEYLFNLEKSFENIEDLQNSILEFNENLNIFVMNDSKKSHKNKKGNEKILKINCCSNIVDCQNKMLPENLIKIEKIIIKELSSNILEEIFLPNKHDNEEINYGNKKYNDIIIKKCNLENVNLSKIFSNVHKFKLKKCQIPFNSNGLFTFQSITELYLESIGLVNDSFNTILSDLKNNINFINNIRCFSIKSNNISTFNLNLDDNNNSDNKYNNLQFINLSNNKINKLNSSIYDLLPSIKLIDLTNNNISFNFRYKPLLDISKKRNSLVLLAKNPGIIKERNREVYCNYLKDILPNICNESLIKNMNFEGLFCGKTYPLLSEINISTFTLNTLNLSYNNLNDQDFIKLIENNNQLFSGIKKLVLCSNYITEAGINNLIEGEYNKLFIGLKKLNISGNPIKLNDLNLLKKIIEGFPTMKTLIIRHTPIEKDFNNFLKIKVIRKNEEMNKKELSSMSEIDLKYEEFIEKEHYLKEKTKLTLKLMNTIGYNYLNSIRKYFPYLLDNIKIETKF